LCPSGCLENHDLKRRNNYETLRFKSLARSISRPSGDALFGTQWHATVGAQSRDKGRQALAFFAKRDLDSRRRQHCMDFNADDIHTVTFLTDGQVRPPFPVGCPGFSPSGASFDGSTCVTSPPFITGQTFIVNFPTAGNYKLVCLVHEDMTATIHVLDTSVKLPHEQSFYDREAAREAQDLLSAPDLLSRHTHDKSANAVAVGIGQILANGGGHETVSLMRFVEPEQVIHAEATVEWTNFDPITPHTITFGEEPAGDPAPPSGNVTIDIDGALHGTISSTSDNVHSGFIISAPQERIGYRKPPWGRPSFVSPSRRREFILTFAHCTTTLV
jgi:plastocyanin